MNENVIVALAGQPNSGKSTVFNMLTGARQFVANYPGVTVEKKSGAFSYDGTRIELVDLPGTYSLTSYSLEERVARNFLLDEKPRVVVNILDASNLKRNLYLTFQLLEMEIPVVMALNMMDVARNRGQYIDTRVLSDLMKVPVVPTVGKKGQGKIELREAIRDLSGGHQANGLFRLDYGELEPVISDLTRQLEKQDILKAGFPLRWLAVKLMEGDSEAERIIRTKMTGGNEFLKEVAQKCLDFESLHEESPEQFIGYQRHMAAQEIIGVCLKTDGRDNVPLSDRVDKLVCHKYLGFIILVGIMYGLYNLSIVQGYHLTNYFWPILANIRGWAASILPAPGFLYDPVFTSLSLWFLDSINALLNYIPIFFILFALIAILEDVGYMPRMAFLLDRLFRRYGLHGQSTLPLVLGGVYVGGCAIPGIMATKAIPDERARLATILTVPMMNCLAKIPLYILMIGAFFPDHKGPAMFFVATITILMALPTARFYTLTFLKKKTSAPFIMEMPPYHLPTILGVLRRSLDRIWLFLKKIVTVVAAVAVVLFVLLQYPGLNDEKKAEFAARSEKAQSAFLKAIRKASFADQIKTESQIMGLIRFDEDLKEAKRGVTDQDKADAINQSFEEKNPVFYQIIKRKGKDGKAAARAFKKLVSERKILRREIKEEKLVSSFLGRIGRAAEPLTRAAGFNWRVNVALLSAFAAKESSVATLGAIYVPTEGNETLEERMKSEQGFTALHALAVILFMALYPPCIPSIIMIKIQSGEYKWMLLAVLFPTLLGLIVACVVFSGGSALGLTGYQSMWTFYGLALAATVVMGLIKTNK